MADEENSTQIHADSVAQINADGTGCLVPKKVSMKFILATLVVLLHLLASSYTIGEEPEIISVDLHIRAVWTGEAFPYDPRSYHYQQPTIEEARGFQSMWRAWWERNKDNFKHGSQLR